ncbi:MAG: PP2C family protein-serine/threonine phosphatase [Planctomycetota bacterium]
MPYRRVDHAENPIIAELTDLFREGSKIKDPRYMADHFGRWGNRGRPSDLFYSVSKRGLPDGSYKITRRFAGNRLASTEPREPADPWRDWNQIPLHRGGFLAEVIACEEPQLFVDLDLASDPNHGDDLASMGSCMAIPHYDEGRALNWALYFYRDPGAIDLEYLEKRIVDGNMLGIATKNLVSKRQAENLAMELRAQFEKIALIQKSLLPQRTPKIPGCELATSYLTSEEAGGDYYDFFMAPDGRCGILIADVTGHGPAAATVMAMLRAILHCYEASDPCPAAIMRYANDKLCQSNLESSFVTAFFCLFDPSTGDLGYALCGHTPPRLLRADGTIEPLDAVGTFPLGVDEAMPLESAEVIMRPGDTLVLFTDGINEAFSASRELFGMKRLDAALAEAGGDPAGVIDAVHRAVYEHTGRIDRDDDQTLVAMRYTGQT